jgi:hypothetical protein
MFPLIFKSNMLKFNDSSAANCQLLRTHITKSVLKHPKYDWMCKLIIIQRCCTRFDFLGAKLCGPDYECAKKIAKIC